MGQALLAESRRAMTSGVGRQLLKLVRTLAIGPLFAQLLLLAASPILSRLYSPREFATVAFFLLGGAAIASIACLKLDNAIVRVASSLEAARIAMVAIMSAFGFTILLFAAGIVALTLLERVEYMALIALLAPYILIGALYDVLNALALRRRLAAIVTKGRIALAISSLFVQIVVGVLKGGATGFVLGLVIGYLCSVIYLTTALRIKPWRWVSRISLDARLILAKYQHDWLYGGPSLLFYTLQNNLPAVILTVVAGSTVGGYYALIQRVVFNPVIIATGILSQSILPWLSRTRDQDSAVFLAKFSSLAGIAMLGMVIAVYPLAEPLFAFIFGEQWRQAGIYAGLLFLLLPYRVLYDVLSILLISENRQGALFLTRGLALLLGVAILFVFSKSATRDLFFWFSFVQAVCALAGIFAVASVLRIPLSSLLRTMSIGLFISYLVVAFEGALSAFLGGNTLNLLFGLVGILIVATSLVAMKTASDDGKA